MTYAHRRKSRPEPRPRRKYGALQLLLFNETVSVEEEDALIGGRSRDMSWIISRFDEKEAFGKHVCEKLTALHVGILASLPTSLD